MKLLLGLVLALVLATPGSAAAGELACDLEGAQDIADGDRMMRLLNGPSDEIEAILGDQFAGYWMSRRDQGWDMGLAPGAMSLEQARAAIDDLLHQRLAADDADFLMRTFTLYAQPYGYAELRSVLDPLDAQLAEALGDRIFWQAGIGCLDGEAHRVEVGLYSDATPDDIAKVRELAAPYGDRVRIYLDGLLEPEGAGGGTVAGRLQAFIKLRSPKRCVRTRTIKFKTRPAARAVIRRITVRVAGKRRPLRDGIRLTIGLKRRGVTPVRVVLRIGDGSRLAHTYRFRRC
jgi:hypothetical protein